MHCFWSLFSFRSITGLNIGLKTGEKYESCGFPVERLRIRILPLKSAFRPKYGPVLDLKRDQKWQHYDAFLKIQAFNEQKFRVEKVYCWPKNGSHWYPFFTLSSLCWWKKNCWTKWNNIGKDKNWTASCTLSWEDKALWWRGKVQPKIKTSPTPIQSPKNKHSYLFQAMTNEKLINGSLAENFLVSFGGYINYSVLRSISVTFGSITEWYNWLFSFFQQLELLKIEW